MRSTGSSMAGHRSGVSNSVGGSRPPSTSRRRIVGVRGQGHVGLVQVGGGRTRRHLAHLGAGHAHVEGPPERPVRRRRRRRPTTPGGTAPSMTLPRRGAREQDGLDAAPEPFRPQVAVVAAEQLVASVSRQRHGGVGARQAGEHRGGDLRRVGEGLVVDVGEPGDDLQRVARRHQQLVVLGAQVGGHRPGVGGFVVAGVFEGDGEGLHLGALLGLHERHHERRVDAPRQEGGHGHIGVQARPHGATQHGVELVEGLGLAAADPLRRVAAPPRPRRAGTRRPRAVRGEPGVVDSSMVTTDAGGSLAMSR